MSTERKQTAYGSFTTTLPSVVAAERLVRGEPGGLMAVVSSTLGRAGIIFMGLFLAGERKHTFKYALAGAAAIEAFVLLRVKYQIDKQAREEAAAGSARAALPVTDTALLP
jgi:hypothetical protein